VRDDPSVVKIRNAAIGNVGQAAGNFRFQFGKLNLAQFTLQPPVAQRFSHHFAGGSIIAFAHGTFHQSSHIGRQSDRQSLNRTHWHLVAYFIILMKRQDAVLMAGRI
jgi:hypothetical protein